MDRRTLSLLIALLAGAAGPAPARAGLIPDPAFGTGGITRTDLAGDDTPLDLLLQPDGKILVGGQSVAGAPGYFIAMARYDANGAPDSAGFGTDGKVSVHFALRDYVNALTLEPDGTIVGAGMQMISGAVSSQTGSIYRFHPDGAIDSTFGLGGYEVGRFEPVSSCEFSAVRVMENGHLQAGGRSDANANGGAYGFGAKVYDTSGVQQDSFLRVAPSTAYRAGACVFHDGNILWANTRINAPHEIVVLRLKDTGATDSTFNGGAALVTSVPAILNADVRIVVQDDGKVLVASTTPRDGGGSNFVVLRFLPDGTFDPGFGGTGRVDVQVGPGTSPDVLRDMIVDPLGRIWLAGRASTTSRQVGLARLLPDGSLDPAFPDGGATLIDLNGPGGEHELMRIRLLPDGSVLGVGHDSASGGGDFFLVRFLPVDATDVPVAAPVGVPLLRAFPNPSRGETSIRFALPQHGRATFDVYDPAGRLVRRVFHGELTEGAASLTWDGRDGSGRVVAAGVYFGRLTSGYGETRSVRIVRVR
ncbi:MAG: FlgD immunoglobulin-like domain containing protein [bacterium]